MNVILLSVMPFKFLFAAFVIYSLVQVITVIMICRHPELSDSKVKAITKMVSKIIKFNKHKPQ